MKADTTDLECRQITINGKKVCYYSSMADASEVALLLHGFMSDATSLQQFAEHLQTEKQLIIPDLPGFGESEPFDEPCSLSTYAKWVDDFCLALHIEPKTVVGYSFGAYVATTHAVQSKKRVDLVLITPVVRVCWQVRLYGNGFRIAIGRARGLAEKLYLAQYDLTTRYLRSHKHPTVRKDLIDRRRSELSYLRPDLVVKLMMEFFKFDFMQYAKRLPGKVTIVTASDDNIASNAATRRFAAEVHSQYTNVIDIRDAGHLLPIEEPALLALTLRSHI